MKGDWQIVRLEQDFGIEHIQLPYYSVTVSDGRSTGACSWRKTHGKGWVATDIYGITEQDVIVALLTGSS